MLGFDYRLPGVKSPDKHKLEKAVEVIRRNNFIASVSGVERNE
jgi:hypothetical protein